MRRFARHDALHGRFFHILQKGQQGIRCYAVQSNSSDKQVDQKKVFEALKLVTKHMESSPAFASHLSDHLSADVKRKLGLSWVLYELKDEFEKADVDKSGYLSYDEFHRWAMSLLVRDKSDEETPPTQKQLNQVFTRQVPPFFGFGITDNAMMIVSGDLIDSTLGLWCGISTMAAAALGNTISKIIRIHALHKMLARAATILRLPDPHLTLYQNKCQSVRKARIYGSMFGMTAGCLIGMMPLLWMDSERKQVKRYSFIDPEDRRVV